MIPFSPPRIDQKIIDEVSKALLSGWITTGPRTKLFEQKISEYCKCKKTIAVNSWTNGMEVLLRWWGIGPGDEVIIPAYTYCASANVIIHTGAKPVMVDINPSDFNVSIENIKSAITNKTKVIMTDYERSDKKGAELCKKHKVTGFPTILLLHGENKEAIYKGKRSKEAISTYLKSL